MTNQQVHFCIFFFKANRLKLPIREPRVWILQPWNPVAVLRLARHLLLKKEMAQCTGLILGILRTAGKNKVQLTSYQY